MLCVLLLNHNGLVLENGANCVELEIELTERPTAPSLHTQPDGRLRLTFHWHDEIGGVLSAVTHPMREFVVDGFLNLWSSDDEARAFEQVDAQTIVIRSK